MRYNRVSQPEFSGFVPVFLRTRGKQMKGLIFAAAFIGMVTPPVVVMAGENFFAWDNQEGFVQAKNCTLKPLKNTRFRISSATGSTAIRQLDAENLRNYQGARQSNLSVGSLVKLIDGYKKRRYSRIEVVGPNRDIRGRWHRWMSERLDRGYIYNQSLRAVDTRLIKLLSRTPSDQLGSIRKNVSGLYLYAVSNDAGSLQKLECSNLNKKRNYLAFLAAERSNGSKPVAIIGVYWDETNIFRRIESRPVRNKSAWLAALETLNRGKPKKQTAPAAHARLQDDSDDQTKKSTEIIRRKNKSAINKSDRKSAIPPLPTRKPKALIDSITKLVCIEPGSLLRVRDRRKNMLFNARPGETVVTYQGWGDAGKKMRIHGKWYTFVKIQFKEREERDQRTGWVAADYIKARSQCPYDYNKIQAIKKRLKNERAAIKKRRFSGKITSLKDKDCCIFPTKKAPTHSYTSGMRRFNANRKGGRLHAASDLYRYRNEPIESVAPGKVISGRRYFYSGTYQLSVRHAGGFVVRYGEINNRAVRGVYYGARVKAGQKIAYMGQVRVYCYRGKRCRPMLHFELYSGKRRGSLSQRRGRYRRRADLLNPTRYLLRWQKLKF